MKLAVKSMHKSIAILLICSILAIRLTGAPTIIFSAIELIEIGNGICLSIDPDCSLDQQKQVQLEDSPSSELNLSSHLMSISHCGEQEGGCLMPLTHVLNLTEIFFALWVRAAYIFHPPRA